MVRPTVADRPDRGAGLLGLLGAFTIVVLLLSFAVQTTVNLSARSAVSGAALDAARAVAGHGATADRRAAAADAEVRLRRVLGSLGSQARVEWGDLADPDVVRLRVVARPASIVPASVAGAVGLGTVDREVQVRVERRR